MTVVHLTLVSVQIN